jgi:hypothetical protein
MVDPNLFERKMASMIYWDKAMKVINAKDIHSPSFFEEGDILKLVPRSTSNGVACFVPISYTAEASNRSKWLTEEEALEGAFDSILLMAQIDHEMDFVCLKILPEKAVYFFRILTQNISLSNQIVVWIDPLKLGFNFCDAYKNGQQFIKCNTNTGKEEFLSKET